MERGRVKTLTRQFNNENAVPSSRIGKPITKPIATTTTTIETKRRAAFGEVGNKITLPSVQNAKPGLLAQKPLAKSTTTKTNFANVTSKVNSNLQNIAPKVRTNIKAKSTVTLAEPKKVEKDVAAEPKKKEEAVVKEDESRVKSDDAICHSLKHLCGIVDIDKEEDNPLLLAEYIKDIMKYLRELEVRFAIKKNFLTTDHKTTISMRGILVNWLAEVHSDFKLLPETFHITVAIVDRFLQDNKSIGRDNLQLVGMAAIFIATKYEEMYVNMDVAELVYISDDSFTKRQILDMECAILKTLNFDLGRPMSLQFLRRYSKVGKVTPLEHTLAKYLLELALIEYPICHLAPSLHAAAASCLASAMIRDSTKPETVWTKELAHYSDYAYSDIFPTMCELAQAIIRAEKNDKLPAIRLKYSKSNNSMVSAHSSLRGHLVKALAQKAKLLK